MISLEDNDAYQLKDSMMLDEEKRLESFKKWSHKTGPCTKQSMAEAGFYHCNVKGWGNAVRCVFCLQTMVQWKKNDEPFPVHRDANPNCIFARLGKPQKKLTGRELIEIIINRNKLMIEHYHEQILNQLDQKIKGCQDIIDQL